MLQIGKDSIYDGIFFDACKKCGRTTAWFNPILRDSMWEIPCKHEMVCHATNG